MRARDIEPGRQYAHRRAGQLPGKVTVTSVMPERVSYVDEHGERGHARPADITGPWDAHEAALARAQAARDELTALAGDAILGADLAYRDDRAVDEDDEVGVSIQLTPDQARRLAGLLAERRRTGVGRGTAGRLRLVDEGESNRPVGDPPPQ